MKKNKKVIGIIFIALLLGILGFFTIRVYANGSLSNERTISEDDEKTLVRMATSITKGENSNDEVNTSTLSSFFNKYVGTGEVNVRVATGNSINVEFNRSGNSYEVDKFKGMIDFEQVDNYIIKYDANGGNLLPYTQMAKQGEQIKLIKIKPTKLGYTFLGWSTVSTATSAEYISEDTYTVNGNVTLYAVWEETVSNSYTITYNANGGVGEPSSQTAQRGQKIIISNQIPTKEGYTFEGWAITSFSSVAQYRGGDTYTGSTNVILYAVWKKEIAQYTITFNANNGTGGPTSLIANKEENINLPLETPTREGFTFLGWHTLASATSPQYIAGGTYKGSSDITLYAVWEKVVTTQKYTITFNANGGSGGPTAITVNAGESVNLPTSTPTKEGFTFLGWNISSDATSAAYSAGQSISPSSNMTLYAVWKQDVVETYTITFNANGGTGGPTLLTGNAGEKVTIPTNIPTKTSYPKTFKGWSTSSSTQIATYQAGQEITLSQNMTLYAVWAYY